MAGNIASAGALRHVCKCSPARHDDHEGVPAWAKKTSLFSNLEDVDKIACEPRATTLYSGSSTTS
jgi:hypothetical protein